MSKTFTLEKTKDPRVFRVMDRKGNWQHYFIDQSESNDQSVGKYLRGVTTILDRGYAKGAFFEDYLVSISREQRDEILKNAGEKGDKVHKYIEVVLSTFGKPEFGNVFNREIGIHSRNSKQEELLTDDEWYCMLSWAHFMNIHEAYVLTYEIPLYSIKYDYCGTGDAFLILKKSCGVSTCPCSKVIGKLGYWDWKSSKGIRPSYSAQGGAYINAENLSEYLGDRKPEYIGLLRLGTSHEKTKGYEAKIYLDDKSTKSEVDKEKNPKKKFALSKRTTEKAFARFLAAKSIDDHEYSPFDPSEDIQEVPDQFEITFKMIGLESNPLIEANLKTPILESDMASGAIIPLDDIKNVPSEETTKVPKRTRKASNGKVRRARKNPKAISSDSSGK